jgi:hypothetical protein
LTVDAKANKIDIGGIIMDNKDLFENEDFDLSDKREEGQAKGENSSVKIVSNEYFEDKTSEKSDDFESFEKDGFTDNNENAGYLFNEPKYENVLNGEHPKSRGWSIASMILGIVSVATCCFGYTAIIAAVLAIIFAIVSRKNLGYFDGMTISGLVLGIFGFVFGIFSLFLWGTFFEEFIKEMENINPENTPGFGDEGF